jgi:ferric-dicitrate binding protein FerR (iron transport regulator)
MSEQLPPDFESNSDFAVDALLEGALRTPPLAPVALERIRAAALQEWQAQITASKVVALPVRRAVSQRRSWFYGLATAAGLAAVSVVGIVVQTEAKPAVIGTVARLGSGDLAAHWSMIRSRQLHVGDPVRVGDALSAGAAVLVSLNGGGTLRVAAGASVEVTSPRELALRQGMVYLDTPPGMAPSDGIRIMTRAGSVEHLGTEFEVVSDAREVRIRVREGKVRLTGAGGAVTAIEGTELVAGSSGVVAERSIDTFGREWSWVMALAPAFNVEGRSLEEFLQWNCRELGRHLEFADMHARQVAQQTILHGSVRGDGVLDSLANVLETTTLTYETRAGVIRVHSGT